MSVRPSDMLATILDGFLEQATGFLDENGCVLAEMLGVEAIGCAEDSASVRAAEYGKEAPDDLRYSFARNRLCSKVAMTTDSDGSECWLGGDRVSITLRPDYQADELSVDACTLLEVPDSESASAIEKLSQHLRRRLRQGRVGWVLGGKAATVPRPGGYVYWLFGLSLSDVLKEDDGIKDVLEHVENEVLLTKTAVELLVDRKISVRQASHMIDRTHRKRLYTVAC